MSDSATKRDQSSTAASSFSAHQRQSAPKPSLKSVPMLLPFLVMTGLIAVFLLGEGRSLVSSRRDEALGHAVASAGLTLAASGTVLWLTRRRSVSALVMFMGVAITAVLEGAQSLVPNRAVQLEDLIAGCGGVLFASLLIELVNTAWPPQRTLWAHVIAATGASIVLLSLLLLYPVPQNVLGGRPGTGTCPATELFGNGERLTISSAALSERCLLTDHGGLGLVGATDATRLQQDTVLVTSLLPDLGELVRRNEAITVRAQVETGAQPGGTILMLWERRAGQLTQMRIVDNNLSTLGPTFNGATRPLTVTAGVKPDTRYVFEVTISDFMMTTRVDGELVATTALAPGWVDGFRGDELQLLIGNIGNLRLPFSGTIEWVEIETG